MLFSELPIIDKVMKVKLNKTYWNKITTEKLSKPILSNKTGHQDEVLKCHGEWT